MESAASPRAWTYEVTDTKLARETKDGTILQLCVYTELVSKIVGETPPRFHVVTPATENSAGVFATDIRVEHLVQELNLADKSGEQVLSVVLE